MNIRTYAGIWLATLAVVVILLVLFQNILLPFVAGMAVAYFLDPVADRLERAGLSRTLATTIITAAFTILVVLFLIFAVPLLQGQIIDFLGNLPDYFQAARGWAEPVIERWTNKLDTEQTDRADAVIEQFSERAAQFVLGMLGNIWAGGMALVNFLALLFITPVVTFYLLRDWDSIVARLNSWLPKAQAENIRELIAGKPRPNWETEAFTKPSASKVSPELTGSLRINEYVELKRLIMEEGLLTKQPGYYTFKIVSTLGLLALSLTFLVVIDNLWLLLLNAVFLAFTFTQIGFIGHDAGHRQIFRSPQKNCAHPPLGEA